MSKPTYCGVPTLHDALERVEYLLERGLWASEEERAELRAEQMELLDLIADQDAPAPVEPHRTWGQDLER